jgi:hypothetical protein
MTKPKKISKPTTVSKLKIDPIVETGKNRREKSLAMAIQIVGNPIFTLNNNPLNRDLKGVLLLSEAIYGYINGDDYLELLAPKEPVQPSEVKAD